MPAGDTLSGMTNPTDADLESLRTATRYDPQRLVLFEHYVSLLAAHDKALHDGTDDMALHRMASSIDAARTTLDESGSPAE
jgi:hypothetical protein